MYEVPGWGDVSDEDILALECRVCGVKAGEGCVLKIRMLEEYPAWWGIKRTQAEDTPPQPLGYPHPIRVQDAQNRRQKELPRGAPFDTLRLTKAELDAYRAKEKAKEDARRAARDLRKAEAAAKEAKLAAIRERRAAMFAYRQAEQADVHKLYVWLRLNGHILWGPP